MIVSHKLPLAKNALLAALDREARERLVRSAELIHVRQGVTLYHAGDPIRHALFPQNGMFSLLSLTEEGEMLELAMVGNDGMVGVPVVLGTKITPYTIMAQISADAIRIRGEIVMDEFNRSVQFRRVVLSHVYVVLSQMSQSAVCNRFHSLEARLSRWLLTTRDRVKSNTFPLTQELISYMLGVPRTSVTATAGQLRRMNLIQYKRGRITIVNPQGLEDTACECYGIIKGYIERFLAA